jgi:GT2 family glycosyltransferase
MARILIAIPTYDKKVDIEILTGIAQLIGVYPEHQFGIDFVSSSLITEARNYLVKRFLDTDFEWLYFWDSDVVIRDMSFISKLLETASTLKADIVGGAYRFKHRSGLYVVGNLEEGKVRNFTKDDLTQPQLVDVIGTGSMLISRKVLEAIDKPCFYFTEHVGGTSPEDFNFCLDAKKKGFLVAVDPRFSTFHYGTAFWEHSGITKEKELVEPS